MRGRRWLAVGGVAVGLFGLTIACGPTAAPPTPTTAPDPFAVVRATSQAAYQAGKAYLDRGDLQGCALIDTAKTNDPDNRADIQHTLDQCLQAIVAQMATSAPTAATQRPIVVATLPATTPVPAPTLVATSAAPKPQSTLPAAAKPQATAAPTQPLAAGATATGSASLAPWRDPQGRFSIAAPSDWSREEKPQSFFGSGVVAFHDPGGRVEMDVSVDNATRVVSPELYAATMELAMNQQVPGYAAEQMLPGTIAGNPSIRRVFTFTMRDASGRELQARGFQIAVLKGATPYIIAGSAPAEQFQEYGPTFDRVVQSFQFS